MRRKYQKSRKGVTLIELLVVIFIFSIIIIIISSSLVQGFMTGRLHSSATKDINRELSAATNLISQKMTNANDNDKAVLPPPYTSTIYGFRIFNSGSDSILAIASSRPIYNSTNFQCNFFGVYDQALYMKQGNCDAIPNLNDLDRKITTGITKITDFTLSGHSFAPGDTIAPYVTVSITGYDPRTQATVKLEETYSLNYPYEKNW